MELTNCSLQNRSKQTQAQLKYTLLSDIMQQILYMAIAMYCYWGNRTTAKSKREAMFSNSITCNRCAEQSIYCKQIKPYEVRTIALNHRVPVAEMFSRLALWKAFRGTRSLSMLVSCLGTVTCSSVAFWDRCSGHRVGADKESGVGMGGLTMRDGALLFPSESSDTCTEKEHERKK